MPIADQSLLVSVLVFLLVAQAILIVTRTSSASAKDRVAQRLSAYTAPLWENRIERSISVLRRRRYSRFPLLDQALARMDLGDSLSLELQQAGLPLLAGEFLFLQLVVGTVGGLLGAVAGWEALGGPIAALGAAVLGFFVPMVWLRYRITQRRTAFEQGLPEALDRVTGALRAGYGLEYGFDLVAREAGALAGGRAGSHHCPARVGFRRGAPAAAPRHGDVLPQPLLHRHVAV